MTDKLENYNLDEYIKPTQYVPSKWEYVQDGVYAVSYNILEAMFNFESMKRGLLMDHEWAKIISVDSDDEHGELILNIQIHKRQDN